MKTAEGEGLGGLQQRVLSQLLNEMDGVGEKKSLSSDGLLIIACTNRPHLIDSAMLRPGIPCPCLCFGIYLPTLM